jgi:hypothetical protein
MARGTVKNRWTAPLRNSKSSVACGEYGIETSRDEVSEMRSSSACVITRSPTLFFVRVFVIASSVPCPVAPKRALLAHGQQSFKPLAAEHVVDWDSLRATREVFRVECHFECHWAAKALKTPANRRKTANPSENAKPLWQLRLRQEMSFWLVFGRSRKESLPPSQVPHNRGSVAWLLRPACGKPSDVLPHVRTGSEPLLQPVRTRVALRRKPNSFQYFHTGPHSPCGENIEFTIHSFFQLLS